MIAIAMISENKKGGRTMKSQLKDINAPLYSHLTAFLAQDSSPYLPVQLMRHKKVSFTMGDFA